MLVNQCVVHVLFEVAERAEDLLNGKIKYHSWLLALQALRVAESIFWGN